jgi:RNase P subunit RPR2
LYHLSIILIFAHSYANSTPWAKRNETKRNETKRNKTKLARQGGMLKTMHLNQNEMKALFCQFCSHLPAAGDESDE